MSELVNMGQVNFSSDDEAMEYFQTHWTHGASSNGNLDGVIYCSKCELRWTPRKSRW